MTILALFVLSSDLAGQPYDCLPRLKPCLRLNSKGVHEIAPWWPGVLMEFSSGVQSSLRGFCVCESENKHSRKCVSHHIILLEILKTVPLQGESTTLH